MNKKARRQVNYRSTSTKATVAKQNKILMLLADAPKGFTVAEIGEVLGVSRQLALYHLKKMAATYQVVMQLEPCVGGGGGVRYRIWDELQLAAHYAREFPQPIYDFSRETAPRQRAA
jgi:DNA-binding transcriptional ArsR family regulator